MLMMVVVVVIRLRLGLGFKEESDGGRCDMVVGREWNSFGK